MEPPFASRIRVVPNRNSIGLLFVLLAMGYAGMSQNNAAAFLLGFLLASLAFVSAIHCWRNLRGVVVSAEPVAPVFEGEPLQVCVLARQTSGRAAQAIELSNRGRGASQLLPQVNPGEPARTELIFPAGGRGRHASFSLRLATSYPLGFFTAVRQVTVAQPYFVYPKPEGDLPFPTDARRAPSAPAGNFPEGDDFAGVRDWRAGESMRHIDWKAAARSERLMVKQWSGGGDERLTFDWEALPPALAPEARLRQLARWIVLAARSEAPYELRLPGRPPVALARGDAHLHECLRALAEYPAS